MDNKQAILGFTKFFKGITGNQNLEIPSEIAEKCGIQAQSVIDEYIGDCNSCDCDTCIHKDDRDSGECYECVKGIQNWYEQADGEYITQSAGDEIRQKNYDSISRQQARSEYADWYGYGYQDNWFYKRLGSMPSKAIPSAEPKKCKDCKWWKDSDGVFRRGIGAESQCPMNRIEVYEGNGYCHMFEPQESEEE